MAKMTPEQVFAGVAFPASRREQRGVKERYTVARQEFYSVCGEYEMQRETMVPMGPVTSHDAGESSQRAVVEMKEESREEM